MTPSQANTDAAPPPSAELLALVGRTEPVETRRPWRAYLVSAALALAVGLGLLALSPLRSDLRWLPSPWLIAGAAFWTFGFFAALAAALVPRRGQVAPDPARAGATAAALTLTAIVAAALFTVDAPGHTVLGPVWTPCFVFGLVCAVVPLLAMRRALRGAVWIGAARIGAAVGAASGALAGLVLQFTCPVGGGLHVAATHAGGVLLAACAGALLAPRLL